MGKKKIGCAHKNATNYGCTDYISDTGTGVGGQVIKPCPDGQENGPAPITEHQNAFCNFYAIEATATATAETAQVTLVVDVDCTIFSTEAKALLVAFWLATAFRKLQIVGATALSTNEGATAFLSQAGLEGYPVT